MIADVKVNVSATLYRYPDLIVTCDPQDQQATDAFSHPKLIVEVLSPKTEAKDRGEKWREYRALPSLEE
ncbi:MAG: Uma2 family endonuclease [Cyanobacteria bacterium J06649_4]